ncbi:zona pellucida sperm-binding protein 4-like [Tiliqua scincoides]|uniref:zona pellucida sperm-binding protein 4-like n=1 Tax=Tiliqua scincoides TaxID=71010 RepID=UPI00346341CD
MESVESTGLWVLECLTQQWYLPKDSSLPSPAPTSGPPPHFRPPSRSPALTAPSTALRSPARPPPAPKTTRREKRAPPPPPTPAAAILVGPESSAAARPSDAGGRWPRPLASSPANQGGAEAGPAGGGWAACAGRCPEQAARAPPRKMLPLSAGAARRLQALTAYPEGKPYPLQNDTICGTSVTLNQDKSVAVKVALAGCLIEAQDGNYQLTIRTEGLGVDGKVTFYKEALRCPEPSLALDSPAPSLCSAIPASDRLPCVARQVSQGDCEALGCCYDFRDRMATCYYGSKVTVRCSPDGQFFIAVSRNATLPPLSLESVHLLSNQGGRCAAVARTAMFILFQFPLSACGTTFKVRDQWLYENELVADRQVLSSPSGSITRDSNFRLTIRCSFSAEDSLPVGVQVATPPPPGAVAQQGPLTLEMRIARDEKYTSYYADSDYPVVKVLRDPVPVEVRILGRRDPVLVLVLHNCWATPSTNPIRKPEWPLLENGCPYKGDNYQTQLVPVGVDSGLEFPSHHQRFIVSTFTFVDVASQRKLTGPVYFHCSASACVPSAQDRCHVRCEVNPQGRSEFNMAGCPAHNLGGNALLSIADMLPT